MKIILIATFAATVVLGACYSVEKETEAVNAYSYPGQGEKEEI